IKHLGHSIYFLLAFWRWPLSPLLSQHKKFYLSCTPLDYLRSHRRLFRTLFFVDSLRRYLNNFLDHPMTWTEYHPVEDMHAFLDYLETTYPDLVSTESIGSSGEGRDMRIAKVSRTENPQYFKVK
ncbi:MAG: M14 family zinc carboxypeptidase, partial [bacterium]